MSQIPEPTIVSLPRDCCPVCGHQFEEVTEQQTCPRCEQTSCRDDLITEDADYAWVL